MIYITLPSNTGYVAWRAGVSRRKFDHIVCDPERRSAASTSTPEMFGQGRESNSPFHLTGKWTAVCSGNAGQRSTASAKRSGFSYFAFVRELDSTLRVGWGMRTFLAALTAAVLLVTSIPASADTSAQLNVSVQVVARAIVTIEGQPEVEVTAVDLERGYIDVPAVGVRLRTNSRSGSLLQATKTSETFSTVELAWGNTTMVIAPESWVRMPYVKGGEVLSVRMRARLAPGASTGRHPLPVHFTASAL